MTNRPDLILSLHSAAAQAVASNVALCSAIAVPEGDGAPDWIHLLPAGSVTTVDGRGPYRVADPAALVAASLEGEARLVLDENHSTDLAAPNGEPAPARGWITGLEARADGIWGKVDWTKAGAALMADRAYRHISPAILHRPDGTVTAILRASLVNKPNLKGLTALHHAALHQEQSMDFLAKLVAALGLPAGSTEDQVMAHIAKMAGGNGNGGHAPALQAALDPIALAVGLSAGADVAAVLAGVQKISGAGNGKAVAELQSELAGVTTRLNTLMSATKTEKATAFVDEAIRAGRVGIKPMRAEYIALHIENPVRAEQLVNAMPILGGDSLVIPLVEPGKNGEVSLNAAQAAAARLLGLDAKTYAETLKSERQATL